MKALALLGGTFDPVHNAHLAMARAALGHLPVEKVVFVPTGMPPYRAPPDAPAADRLAMLKLVTRENTRFAIDERELAPHATGYMADTLRSMHRDFPGQKFFLLVGADQFAKLDTWERPDEVRRLSEVAVFARPGWTIGAKGVKTIEMPLMEDSATEVRAKLRRGEDISGMVPAPVAEYIVRHKLYA